MLQKLGFKEGDKLGASNNLHARADPIMVDFKEGKGGIGHDAEKKRKIREEMEAEVKRRKVDEEKEVGERVGFRERVGMEREERRTEGLVRGAMSVLEGLEEGGDVPPGDKAVKGEEEEEEKERGPAEEIGDSIKAAEESKRKRKIPTKQVNVLYRSLVRERERKEHERRMRYDLLQSLSRNTNYDDETEDKHDRQALGNEETEMEEEADEELDDFESLPAKERLEKLTKYLREKWWYCFWCKYRYPDRELEGCPGETEEEHG